MDRVLQVFWSIRRSPGEYLPERSIWSLRNFLCGYSSRVSMEGVDSKMRLLYPLFQAWLESIFMLQPTTHSVYEIVDFCTDGSEDAFDNFYALFEKFQEEQDSVVAEYQVSDNQIPRRDLFEVLRSIRKRPELWVGHPPFSGICAHIAGHERAGRDLGLPQTPDEKLYDEFKLWIEKDKLRGQGQRPWFKLIKFSSFHDCGVSRASAYSHFFQWLDEFAIRIEKPGLFAAN